MSFMKYYYFKDLCRNNNNTFRIRTSAARMIARLPRYSHISDYMINELHWLPILAHVRYKVLLLVARSQQGLAPKYLCELMSKPPSARSSRPLHYADHCDLLIQ